MFTQTKLGTSRYERRKKYEHIFIFGDKSHKLFCYKKAGRIFFKCIKTQEVIKSTYLKGLSCLEAVISHQIEYMGPI